MACLLTQSWIRSDQGTRGAWRSVVQQKKPAISGRLTSLPSLIRALRADLGNSQLRYGAVARRIGKDHIEDASGIEPSP
jgi:hypothetical protein